jgi:tetratricopeptide (TPR) repeat protein
MILMCSAPQAFASGGGAMAGRAPHDIAVETYNEGLRYRDHAWDLEKQLAASQDPKEKEKLESQIRKTYQAAVRSQRYAVQKEPSMFQAHSELGYALRKSGDYQAALNAYDKALTLQPNYAEAIEYRAEAYLGLNRMSEAREAYLQLFNGGDSKNAGLLGSAMAKWLEQHRADASGVTAETINEFDTWLAQRKEITRQMGGTTAGSWR